MSDLGQMIGRALLAGRHMNPLRVLSLGAGVQSSTLALMMATGEVEPVDCAIFADTGAEPANVYEWLDWLETQVPFPIHRVMWKDGLERNIIESVEGGRFAGAPFFTEVPLSAEEGRLRRQCTREFKVQPITRKLRELLGLAPGARAPKQTLVTQFLGISWDEAHRMKPSREHWIAHRFPLVELERTRGHCLEWMQARGYPQPPRSACRWCPYKSDAEWQRIKNEPDEWVQVVAMDRRIRAGVRGTTQRLYLHRSLKPIDEVDLRSAEDAGQLSMFGNECEGMCGV